MRSNSYKTATAAHVAVLGFLDAKAPSHYDLIEMKSKILSRMRSPILFADFFRGDGPNH